MQHTSSDKIRFSSLLSGLHHFRLPGILVLWPPFILGWGHLEVVGLLPWLGVLLFFQAWVFLSNDVADWDVDPPHPRRLARGHATRAARLSLGLFVIGATGISLILHSHPGIMLCLAGAVLLNLTYNAPPLRLNHRGGGALPQALGIGIVLPCWGALAAEAPLPAPPLLFQGILAGAALAWGSALGDWPDDIGSKKTAATERGPRVTAFLLMLAMAGALGPWFAVLALAALPACLQGHRSGNTRRLAEVAGCLTPLLWGVARLSA